MIRLADAMCLGGLIFFCIFLYIFVDDVLKMGGR